MHTYITVTLILPTFKFAILHDVASNRMQILVQLCCHFCKTSENQIKVKERIVEKKNKLHRVLLKTFRERNKFMHLFGDSAFDDAVRECFMQSWEAVWL